MTRATILAQAVAATLIGVWGGILAQASTFDTVERWWGGSAVVSAAVAFAWILLRFSSQQKDSWVAQLVAANGRAKQAEADRATCYEERVNDTRLAQERYDKIRAENDMWRQRCKDSED